MVALDEVAQHEYEFLRLVVVTGAPGIAAAAGVVRIEESLDGTPWLGDALGHDLFGDRWRHPARRLLREEVVRSIQQAGGDAGLLASATVSS